MQSVKNEFVNKIGPSVGITKVASRKLFSGLLQSIERGLKNGKTVKFYGLGVFYKANNRRKGPNNLPVRFKKRVAFRVSVPLKIKINS